MKSKVTCVVSACPDIYSGYGKRSLDFIKELIRVRPDWDIKILSQRWGECRAGYLRDHNETDLISRIIEKLTERPDVWIQITVPNEFQAVGKFNIGVTAAMETTLCDASWIQGCNRMNLILVSSKHSKFSLDNSKYLENRTNKPLELTTPVEILFEGLDKSKYFKIKGQYKSPVLEELTSNWNFLCVGHWLPGDYGEDRKNIGYTIKAFLETFKDRDEAPGLILKITEGTSSIVDREDILSRIYTVRESVKYSKSLPQIFLLHGDLTDDEMNEIYNDCRIKAMVSFTKGEGFGRPLLEFAATGKPVLCSGWSGQLDFLSKEFSPLVGGSIVRVHPSAVVDHVILSEASWFKPDDAQACVGLNQVYLQYGEWKIKAEKQAKIINSKFSMAKMGDKLSGYLEKYVPNFPEKLEFQLPDLKSVN